MQFVVISEHPPELCPMSNAKVRDLLRQTSTELPSLADKLGVNIVTTNVFGPDHLIYMVAEAGSIDNVRDFVLQSRLAQWNKTQVHATWSMEEAMSKLEDLPTIF